MIAEMLMCLALNVYHESKNQSLIGQIAVAQVTMNRVRDERYPNNVCDVVKQGLTYKWNPSIPIRNKCQFSWYCDGKSDKPKDEHAWDKAMLVAHGVYYGNLDDFVEGATHYHAHYVLPSWASSKTYITRIDDHIFYRWDINYE
jgi:spore germination cell wall hydrolase CwlJ-like protein